jgi:hypothetical protein|nr:MAG TPA: hypothetical protein [Caudoviricetes sp.]DAU01614.1 MAG TPA: hypothetical protein [Caudoviricetes sp.]
MSESATTLDERKEGFDKLKSFLPSCPSKDWLSSNLTELVIGETPSFYCFYIGNVLYPIAKVSLYSSKEAFLNDIYHRWVEAANKGEFGVTKSNRGKKDFSSIFKMDDDEEGIWVAKETTYTSIFSFLSKCFPFLKTRDKKITWIK